MVYYKRLKLFILKKIQANSAINKMTLKNLAICFAPNFFLAQVNLSKNGLNTKEYAKFEAMQKDMPALLEITEMLIEHIEIISKIPNSFIMQLREYNEEHDDTSNHKVKNVCVLVNRFCEFRNFSGYSAERRKILRVAKRSHPLLSQLANLL